MSASCVHVSALLHALVALKPGHDMHCDDSDMDSDEEQPCTSTLCQWKRPRKRKSAAMQVEKAEFEKHEYGRIKKYNIESLENYDPRVEHFRGKIAERIPNLLNDIKGKGLCVSLLLDKSMRVATPERAVLSKEVLLQKVEQLKLKLKVSDNDIRTIEQSTRLQSNSPKWFEVRRFRLTSSMFGRVKQLKASTPPDNLVLSILGVKQISGKQFEYGKNMEKIALAEYVKYQHNSGHEGLYAASSGFIVSSQHSFLGASPDSCVYDPLNPLDPYGYCEIKCPYKYQDISPSEAAEKSDFMLQKDHNGVVKLKESHVYYSQVQGQMGVGGRPWCDFVVYTKKGIHVERISFNTDFWNRDLLPKLVSFYDHCIGPEIVCPQHPFGLPLRDLRNE